MKYEPDVGITINTYFTRRHVYWFSYAQNVLRRAKNTKYEMQSNGGNGDYF